MAFGDFTPLTPEGEEALVTEVTVTTDGVVATVTMVTGTFEDVVFTGNDVSNDGIDAPFPEGTGTTLVAIVLILGNRVEVPDPADTMSIDGAAAPDLTVVLAIKGTPVSDPADKLPVEDPGRVSLTAEAEVVLLEEISFPRARRFLIFKALTWRERNLLHCTEDHPLHKGHGYSSVHGRHRSHNACVSVSTRGVEQFSPGHKGDVMGTLAKTSIIYEGERPVIKNTKWPTPRVIRKNFQNLDLRRRINK